MEWRRTAIVSNIVSTDDLRVVHIVLSLEVGGLERIVVDLVREGKLLGQRPEVICLDEPGALAGAAEAAGAPVTSIRKSPGVRLKTIQRMAEALRRGEPQIIHTHQTGALLYAGLASLLLPKMVLV